jgi:hypothetical protein
MDEFEDAVADQLVDLVAEDPGGGAADVEDGPVLAQPLDAVRQVLHQGAEELFTLPQFFEMQGPIDRVPDRMLEQVLVQAVLVEVIRGTGQQGIQHQAVTARPGKKNHGSDTRGSHRGPDQVEAGAISQPMIDEVCIVLPGLYRVQPFIKPRRPLHLEPVKAGRPEQTLGQDEIILVVVNQQHPNDPFGHALDYGGETGSAPDQYKKGLRTED